MLTGGQQTQLSTWHPHIPGWSGSRAENGSKFSAPSLLPTSRRRPSYPEYADHAHHRDSPPLRPLSRALSCGRPRMETYHGHVRTPADAIILFEACRLGLLPRVQRRLSEKERQSIKSGSVFVWDEREAGMRRWTDGKSWSASRVSGSFLTYREMEGKRGGSNFAAPVSATRGKAGKSPTSTRGSDSDVEMGDEGPDGYRYKPDGLMKQSFSITTSTSQHLHLISYYSRSHPTASSLNQPTNDPNLRHIRPQKGMYPESTVHEQQNVPAVTRGPMPGAHYPTAHHVLPTPGPQGYGPSGATHPHNYAAHQAYGWPSSPAATPSPKHSSGPYASSAQLSAPSGASASASPLPFNQPLPPAATSMTSNTLDRPPAPLSDSTLPPPPPPLGHRSVAGTANGSLQRPNHIPNPSPRVAQASFVAQHAAEPGPATANVNSKIDPRLTTMNATMPEAVQLRDVRTPPELAGHMDTAEGQSSRHPRTPSNTLPKIGVLMNGNAADNADASSDQSGSRAGSRSPGGTRKADGPHDIPSEKLGFREDMRALRVLDRAFSA